jgi:hypothetical protein
MTDLGARTRQIGTFPVYRENIRVFAGGFGPTGRGANMHREAGSSRYTSMLRYACSPCAEHHKKRVPEIFPLPSSSGLPAEQKGQSIGKKVSPSIFLSFLPRSFSFYNPDLTFPAKSLIKQTHESRYYFHM